MRASSENMVSDNLFDLSYVRCDFFDSILSGNTDEMEKVIDIVLSTAQALRVYLSNCEEDEDSSLSQKIDELQWYERRLTQEIHCAIRGKVPDIDQKLSKLSGEIEFYKEQLNRVTEELLTLDIELEDLSASRTNNLLFDKPHVLKPDLIVSAKREQIVILKEKRRNIQARISYLEMRINELKSSN